MTRTGIPFSYRNFEFPSCICLPNYCVADLYEITLNKPLLCVTDGATNRKKESNLTAYFDPDQSFHNFRA